MLHRQGTMLMLLMLLPSVLCRDTQLEKNFIIKRVESCPDEGYYFRRELARNSVTPGHCFLCFCQIDGSALCWRRENRRCDLESYHYHNVGKRKRNARVKRSVPLGDIILRDVDGDFFKKKLQKQCKLHESNNSEGCPSEFDNKLTDTFYKGTQRLTIIRKLPKFRTTVNNGAIAATISNTKLQKRVVYNAVTNTRHKRHPSKNDDQDGSKRILRSKAPPKKIVKKYAMKKVLSAVTPTTNISKHIPTPPNVTQDAVRKIIAIVQKIMTNDLKKGNSSKIFNAAIKKHMLHHNVNKKYDTPSKSGTKKYIGQKPIPRTKREIRLDNIGLIGINATNSKPLPTETSLGNEEIMVEKFTYSSSVLLQTPALPQTSTQSTPITNLAISGSVYNDVYSVTDVAETDAIPMVTIVDRNYYGYLNNNNSTLLLTTNEPILNISSENPRLVTSQQNIYNTITESFINSSSIKADVVTKPDNMIYLIDRVPIGNDLKFKKWSQIKLLKDKLKQYKIELVKTKNFDNIFSTRRKEVAETSKKRNRKGRIKNPMKKMGIPKKYNIRRLLNTTKPANSNKVNKNITNIFYINSKITHLQNIVKNLLQRLNRDNNKKIKGKTTQLNVIRYMRKLLHIIFNSKQTNSSIYHNHIIKILCESFGSCRIDKKEEKLLKSKLDHIHLEIKKILETVTLIKGLLQVIDISSNNTGRKNKSSSTFNDDILKLNSILKNNYTDSITKPLTATQKMQIEYIKRNTHVFLESIGKFAALLNETITILTKSKQSHINKYSHKPSPNVANNDRAFKYIKNLLFKYNIIHNTFIKRMYNVITSFEDKINPEYRSQVNMQRAYKNTVINNYSHNIISNLRKLRHLTETLNSRQKREVGRDDDAIEYLLMLMEYLVKQNYPLDAAPVNDGIDLLLESIKHSPDIKTTRKKVLDNVSILSIISRTIQPNQFNQVTTENFIYPKKFSQEHDQKNITNSASKLGVSHTEEVEDVRNYDDKYLITKQIENNTEAAIYRSNDETTTLKFKLDIPTDNNIIDNEVFSKSEIDKSIDKLEQKFRDTENSRRYETYNSDSEDENQATEISISEAVIEIHVKTDKNTSESALKDVEESSVSKVVYKSPQLEWVDKNAKDYKDYKSVNLLMSSTTTTTRATTTSKPKEDDISVLSKEEKRVKHIEKSKVDIEDVLFKKQMDLLNSLDYGIEKLNTDLDDSKDDVADERFLNDNFAAYVV